jgi:hypothetical protein
MQSTKQCRVGRLPQGRAAQVGYCQGMAFVTGIVLMYLPEEPAFQARARAEQAPSALGLRCGAAPIPCPMQLRPPMRKALDSVPPHRPRPWSSLASRGARALLHPSAPCCKAPHGSPAGAPALTHRGGGALSGAGNPGSRALPVTVLQQSRRPMADSRPAGRRCWYGCWGRAARTCAPSTCRAWRA